MEERGSMACILMAAGDVGSLGAVLAKALARQGYERHDEPPPTGYPAAQDEWLGLQVGVAGPHEIPCVVTLEVDAVFRVACHLSAAVGAEPLVAWRRYRGCPPVLKAFVDGAPKWKLGSDPDHEVTYPVPIGDDQRIAEAEAAGLPTDPEGIDRLLDNVSVQVRLGFIHRSSPLRRA